MRNPQEIASIIKEEAKRKGISTGKMLSDCGVSKNALSSMKAGFNPRIENITKIAEYLGCSVDYLLGREESMRDMVYEHSYADDDASVKEQLMELLGYDEKREEHKIGIDLGTTYSFDGQKITPEDIRSIQYEPIIIKASESDWTQILNRLSPESLVKLRDYTRFLLWLQDQDAANSLKSQK